MDDQRKKATNKRAPPMNDIPLIALTLVAAPAFPPLLPDPLPVVVGAPATTVTVCPPDPDPLPLPVVGSQSPQIGVRVVDACVRVAVTSGVVVAPDPPPNPPPLAEEVGAEVSNVSVFPKVSVGWLYEYVGVGSL